MVGVPTVLFSYAVCRLPLLLAFLFRKFMPKPPSAPPLIESSGLLYEIISLFLQLLPQMKYNPICVCYAGFLLFFIHIDEAGDCG